MREVLAGTRAELSEAIAKALARIEAITDQGEAERAAGQLYDSLTEAIAAVGGVAP